MSSLAGRMRLARMSSANRGGPDRRHSTVSNSSAKSWLCPFDVDANSRTVDARTLGSSLYMASCRRVSSTSGSRSNRARNASNASSGKSHRLDACLVTNQARASATCSRVYHVYDVRAAGDSDLGDLSIAFPLGTDSRKPMGDKILSTNQEVSPERTFTRMQEPHRAVEPRRPSAKVSTPRWKPDTSRCLWCERAGRQQRNACGRTWGQLYRFAAKRLGCTGQNPAELADPHKKKRGGYHTWTDAEIERFREMVPTGSKPCLALDFLLATGASRLDAVGLTRANI